MMKTLNLSFFFFFALFLSGCESDRIERQGNSISFKEDSLQYKVEWLSPRLVRILSYPQGDTLITQRLVVEQGVPPFTDFNIASTGGEYIFSTSELSVHFDKEEKAFSFREVKTDKLLLQEKGNREAREFHRTEVAGEKCLHVVQRFIPTEDEALYGLGQYQTGTLNYREDTALLLQANMDIVNPFLVSTNGYGLLWDNYSSTRFRDNNNEYYFDSEVGDASDYYFVYGKNMDEVIGGYRALTGSAPMFGKWVFGFWQSKERYRSFEELEAVVREYRRRNIPLDNIVQDWEYWGDKAHWNSLEFDTRHFNRPEEVIRNLHRQHHVHFMLSVWPGFGPETTIYKSLDSLGALFDEPTWAGYKVFDAYHPEAREIFWQHLKKGLYDKGVDAWWMDATEPSFKEGFTQLKQEEKTKAAGKTHLGMFHRYLNVYSLELMKSFYGHLREADSTSRPFILTRSAFAGQQKYGTAIWSGDVSASWENFRKQIAAGLNLSMSGIPYWTSDIGGFFVTERDAQYPRGLEDPEYKELYCRWFQFGAFCPLFRAHGTNVPREIWQFGKPGSLYYDTQLKYIYLRYRLLPYIYSLARKVSTEHYTLMRGLAMDFSNDSAAFEISNAYMFGNAFLVRPVLEPAMPGITQQTATYLPEHAGKYWYNFYTGEVIEGGKLHTMPTPLDVMPLFTKGGSIVPMGNVKQYASEYPDSQLEIRVYSGTDATFDLYDDEGDNREFEKGNFAETELSWSESAKTFTIGKREGSYRGMPATMQLTVKIYTPEKNYTTEKTVEYTGEKIVLHF